VRREKIWLERQSDEEANGSGGLGKEGEVIGRPSLGLFKPFA